MKQITTATVRVAAFATILAALTGFAGAVVADGMTKKEMTGGMKSGMDMEAKKMGMENSGMSDDTMMKKKDDMMEKPMSGDGMMQGDMKKGMN